MKPLVHLHAKDHILSRADALDWTAYQVRNPFLMDGFVNPMKHNLLSVFTQLHNQTLNIYTHLIGALFFAWMTMKAHDWITFWYCLAATNCFACSSIWHSTSYISQRVYNLGLMFDYLGTTLMTAASNFMVLFAELQGDPIGVVVSILLAVYSAFYVVKKYVSTDISVVTFGPVFALHASLAIIFWLIGGMMYSRGLTLSIVYSLYAIGLFVHQKRIPERFFPDAYVFFSHPIMHTCVVVAAMVLLCGYSDHMNSIVVSVLEFEVALGLIGW